MTDDPLTTDPETGVPGRARLPPRRRPLQGQGLLQHRLRHARAATASSSAPPSDGADKTTPRRPRSAEGRRRPTRRTSDAKPKADAKPSPRRSAALARRKRATWRCARRRRRPSARLRRRAASPRRRPAGSASARRRTWRSSRTARAAPGAPMSERDRLRARASAIHGQRMKPAGESTRRLHRRDDLLLAALRASGRPRARLQRFLRVRDERERLLAVDVRRAGAAAAACSRRCESRR